MDQRRITYNNIKLFYITSPFLMSYLTNVTLNCEITVVRKQHLFYLFFMNVFFYLAKSLYLLGVVTIRPDLVCTLLGELIVV